MREGSGAGGRRGETKPDIGTGEMREDTTEIETMIEAGVTAETETETGVTTGPTGPGDTEC